MKTEDLLVGASLLGVAYIVYKTFIKPANAATAEKAAITRRSEYVYDPLSIMQAQYEPLTIASVDPIKQYIKTGGAEGSW